MVGDIDNIIKPILDSLIGLIYLDDQQIECLHIEKIEPGRTRVFSNPGPKLVEALERTEPMVYIRVDVDRIDGPST